VEIRVRDKPRDEPTEKELSGYSEKWGTSSNLEQYNIALMKVCEPVDVCSSNDGRAKFMQH
jgi:hypothetical protein